MDAAGDEEDQAAELEKSASQVIAWPDLANYATARRVV